MNAMKVVGVLLVQSAFLASTLCSAAEQSVTSDTNVSISEFTKNGVPCIKELCLGDGLDELRKILWDVVKDKASAMIVKSSMADLEKKYRGNFTASAPYLAGTWRQLRFDNQALSKLDEVIAACADTPSLTGTYISSNGNPTTVEIDLVPTASNMEQKWTVTSIRRSFPDGLKNQREEISAQLDARYGAFDYKKHVMQMVHKDGDAQYVGDGYGFTIKTLWPHITERLQLHPACNGTKRINID